MRVAAIILAILGAAWLGGLIFFAMLLPNKAPLYDNVDRYQAAVVLTGGSGRVAEGLSLYARGVTKKLFITGVGKGVSTKQLVATYHKNHADAVAVSDIRGIDVDAKARSTVANARYTKSWVQREGITKALLITAGYHMPRSELIFTRAIPQVQWITSPVYPENYHPQFWWKDTRALILVISEYHKYVFTYMFG